LVERKNKNGSWTDRGIRLEGRIMNKLGGSKNHLGRKKGRVKSKGRRAQAGVNQR
jgi:hypothetical protein